MSLMPEDADGNELARGQDGYWHITKRKMRRGRYPLKYMKVGERTSSRR